MRPKRSELAKLYGPIRDGVWEDAIAHTMLYHVPRELLHSLRYRGAPVHAITVNKDMYKPLELAFKAIIYSEWTSFVTSFDGCYNVRLVRGGTKISAHAYALAIDLNALTNQLGTKGDMDVRIIRSFEMHGFIWGGGFERKDPMHFQYLEEDQ